MFARMIVSEKIMKLNVETFIKSIFLRDLSRSHRLSQYWRKNYEQVIATSTVLLVQQKVRNYYVL